MRLIPPGRPGRVGVLGGVAAALLLVLLIPRLPGALSHAERSEERARLAGQLREISVEADSVDAGLVAAQERLASRRERAAGLSKEIQSQEREISRLEEHLSELQILVAVHAEQMTPTE